ncbi:MAG: YceH family protein [Acidobacteria bacterium]|nr:YceH family protein [Acidobacteriota bacterium]
MPLTDDTPPPRLPRPLDAAEIRVLGALLEKQQATPEYYPLTLHALVAACNQKTNREPVTELDEAAVLAALERLREHVLVWKTGGARAEKWEQNVDRRWGLDAAGKAVMTLLLLRGEQTPGELRGRSDRLHAFATPGEVEDALRALAAGPEPLAAERGRRPGQKETRWTHLVGGPVADVEAARHATPGPPPSELAFRLASLEAAVAALGRDLGELKKKLGED